MRRRFIETLAEIADTDSRVMLLTGDLGYTVVEPFAHRFPDRFINVGVAEQNMIGIATGLAEAGFIPFTYSIATFAILRPFEFIRNGPILHRLPVRIVGIGGGFEYGTAGATHHALEDVAVLRSQREISIICPADYEQASEALRRTWAAPGPIYYRLGKDETSVVPSLNGRFEQTRGVVLREGHDLLFIALGPAARTAMEAADTLRRDGVSAGVLLVSAIQPAPASHLVEVIRSYPIVLTLESHGAIGGLGSLVSEIVAAHGLRCRVKVCGAGAPVHESGGEAYLLRRHGLSADAIHATARQLVEATGS